MQENQIITGFVEFKGAVMDNVSYDKDQEKGIDKPMHKYEYWVRVRCRIADIDQWYETADGYVCVTFNNGSEWKFKSKYDYFTDMMVSYDQLVVNPQLN
jgi:hypothetical protein